MKASRRSARGGATVELAVLMMVLIPTILYTLYLEDLLIYRYDLEETVVSTPWDFSNHDYRKDKSKVAGNVRTAAMKTFWDHTSAWNTYSDEQHDADSIDHHEGSMAAHQCWLAKGGKEIACGIDDKVGMTIQPQFNFKNQGGLATCDARLGVQNYFISEQLFTWWGRVGMTGNKQGEESRMKRHDWSPSGQGKIQADVHGEAKKDPYLYPPMKSGVMADTWALYRMQTVDPTMHPADSLTEFGTWVQIPYGTRSSYKKDAIKFADDAIKAKILSDKVKKDGIGDDIEKTAPVAWKSDPKRPFGKHTTSGWSDPEHQATQQKQENKYMGLPESTW